MPSHQDCSRNPDGSISTMLLRRRRPGSIRSSVVQSGEFSAVGAGGSPGALPPAGNASGASTSCLGGRHPVGWPPLQRYAASVRNADVASTTRV